MKKSILSSFVSVPILCLFYFLIGLNGSAQEIRNVDSLKQAATSKIDTVRFKAYSFLSWRLKENNKQEALKYANMLFKEATAADNKKWITRSLGDLSVIYSFTGDFKKAREYAERAVKAAKLAGNKKDYAHALFNLSEMKTRSNELASALELKLEALKLYEELKKNYYIVVVCNSIGEMYNDIGNFKLSNAYLMRANAIVKETGNLYLEALTLGGIADNYKSLGQFDSSLVLFKQVKPLFKEIEDYSNYSTACSRLGELYLVKGNIKASVSEYKEALRVSREMQDTGSVAAMEASLAKVLIKEGNFAEAESLLLNSLATAQKFGNKVAEQNFFEYLATLYTYKKDPVKAEMYLKKYKDLRDTAFSKDLAKRFSEAQTKFEVEKKDLELARNQSELKVRKEQAFIKNIIIASVFALLVLLCVMGYLFYRKKQVEQKAKLDAELNRQKEIRIRSVIEAEEKERRRIAQDLHDGIGQILSAAKLNLSSIEGTWSPDNEAQKFALKNTLDLIDDSVREVRAVSHNMMPNTLIKLGLASAVKEFITKMDSLPNLKIDLEIVGLEQRLEENAETALYRAIQETVSNIIKHAKADKIGIQMIRHEKEFSVVIEDNGVGFDVRKINEFEGIGLKNIISRIELIKGTVHFDSSVNRGTTVTIEIPLAG